MASVKKTDRCDGIVHAKRCLVSVQIQEEIYYLPRKVEGLYSSHVPLRVYTRQPGESYTDHKVNFERSTDSNDFN